MSFESRPSRERTKSELEKTDISAKNSLNDRSGLNSDLVFRRSTQVEEAEQVK